ncbi:hypothetical protein QCA50_008778 [Cerrena zonata]|uniref:Uncharacterized protein n=1 Tax=Cerrena zonata TaxID=2478898 RepID=A0AAW0GHE8_9APHY
MQDLTLEVKDIDRSARFAMVWNPKTGKNSRFLGVSSEPDPDQLEALRDAVSKASLEIGEPGWYYRRC